MMLIHKTFLWTPKGASPSLCKQEYGLVYIRSCTTPARGSAGLPGQGALENGWTVIPRASCIFTDSEM